MHLQTKSLVRRPIQVRLCGSRLNSPSSVSLRRKEVGETVPKPCRVGHLEANSRRAARQIWTEFLHPTLRETRPQCRPIIYAGAERGSCWHIRASPPTGAIHDNLRRLVFSRRCRRRHTFYHKFDRTASRISS